MDENKIKSKKLKWNNKNTLPSLPCECAVFTVSNQSYKQVIVSSSRRRRLLCRQLSLFLVCPATHWWSIHKVHFAAKNHKRDKVKLDHYKIRNWAAIRFWYGFIYTFFSLDRISLEYPFEQNVCTRKISTEENRTEKSKNQRKK